MSRYDRYLTPTDRMVLEAIERAPSDAEDIRSYCRDKGVDIERVDTHTRKLHRYGYIYRKTSNYKYSNVWAVKNVY